MITPANAKAMLELSTEFPDVGPKTGAASLSLS
jgi:hypothetical protein